MTLLSMLLVFVGLAQAETADGIVARARAANQVESSIQEVRMTIVSKSGSERVRELELRSRRDDDQVGTLLHITAPSDVAGVKMLMIDHDAKTDEQLVYMPAIGRTNRIAGSSRKGAFVGSDFSYEDLDIREAADGTHTLVEDNAETWVIDTVPADSPQYTRVRTTITKADLVARRIEFFDRKGEPLKLLEVLETKKVGDVTLPVRTKMSNLQRGTHTVLEIRSHRLDVPDSELPASAFTAAQLER